MAKSFGSDVTRSIALLFSLLFALLSLNNTWSLASITNTAENESRLAEVQSRIVKYQLDTKPYAIWPKDLLNILEKKDKPVVLVDTRLDEEFAISHLPNALTLSQFKSKKEEYRNHFIVTYCTIGFRSEEFAEELIKEGFHAVNLVGSILLWLHEGNAIFDAQEKPTKNVHVYSKEWNLAPVEYHAHFKEPFWKKWLRRI